MTRALRVFRFVGDAKVNGKKMINVANRGEGDKLTPKLLDAIGDAFNSNDIDAVMSFFSKDAVFDHASGVDAHGRRFAGEAEIRAAFQSLFDNVDNVHWTTLDARIAGDKAYCEYRRVARLKNGQVQDFLSVDVLTFRDGLIVHKDTYFKIRTI